MNLFTIVNKDGKFVSTYSTGLGGPITNICYLTKQMDVYPSFSEAEKAMKGLALYSNHKESSQWRVVQVEVKINQKN